MNITQLKSNIWSELKMKKVEDPDGEGAKVDAQRGQVKHCQASCKL